MSLGREKKSWRAGSVTFATGPVVVESDGAGDGSGIAAAVAAALRFFDEEWLLFTPGVDCREDSLVMPRAAAAIRTCLVTGKAGGGGENVHVTHCN